MNMKNLTKYGAVLTMAALVAASHGQITKSGSGYLFRMKFSKGQKASYSMNINGEGQGQKFAMSVPMTTTVTGVSGSVGTVVYKIGPSVMSLNGNAMPQQPVRNVTVQQDARGNIVGGQGAQMGGMTSVGLPAKAISIGSTWKANTKTAAAVAGPMDVEATYKFVGIEQMGGRQAAKISIQMKGKGQANVTGSGTMWLSVADGSLIKTTNRMNVSMGAQSMPMTMNIVRK